MKLNLLVIVPARKGSTGLKNKNTLLLNNLPLVEFSFKAASLIKEKKRYLFCSSDSKKILNLSKKYDFRDNILRPKKKSGKYSRDIDFINHSLKYLNKKQLFFKYGLILRPTNPLRILSNLNKAYKVFKQNKSATSLKAVFPSKENPFKTWTINKNFLKNVSKKIKNINDQFNAPRQILPKTYRQTGTIEFFKINYKSKISSMSGRKILPFEVSEYEALDIDNIKDLIKGSKIIKKYPFKFINPSINK